MFRGILTDREGNLSIQKLFKMGWIADQGGFDPDPTLKKKKQIWILISIKKQPDKIIKFKLYFFQYKVNIIVLLIPHHNNE